MSPKEGKWVELRRLHDPVDAQIVIDFLTDNGIRVQRLGGPNNALPTIGLNDIRIEVPEDDLQHANEVLVALREGGADDHPFRGSSHARAPESYQPPVDRRKWPFVLFAALLVPGGGHFYARHGAAGALFAAGALGCLLGAWFGMPMIYRAYFLLVAFDAVSAPFAVRRYNARAVPSDARQRVWALAAVVVAFVVGVLAPYSPAVDQ